MTQEERIKRIKKLVSFIYIFRYATRKQMEELIRSTTCVMFPHRTIEAALSDGYIQYCYEAVSGCNIYYLTVAAKELIQDTEPFVDYYKFDKRHTGLNILKHQKFLVEAFFILRKHLEIKEWRSEWVLRVGRKKWQKIPDGQITFNSGLKIAIEAETSYKDITGWKDFVYRYRHDIERAPLYHAALIVAGNKDYLTGVIIKLFNFAPEFSHKRFIFTEPEMLKTGKCFYRNEVYPLKDVISLLEKEVVKQ